MWVGADGVIIFKSSYSLKLAFHYFSPNHALNTVSSTLIVKIIRHAKDQKKIAEITITAPTMNK